MRTWLATLILALVCGPAYAGQGKAKIDLIYNLMLKRGDAVTTTDVLDGLESGDRFRLYLKPNQEVFAYLVVKRDADDFRLLYPNTHIDRGKNLLDKKQTFVYPDRGWLRLDADAGMERVYLILATVRISELEARFALHETIFSEATLVDIRDRYQSKTSYRREMADGEVRVRFRSRDLPAVLIEEITLRHM